MAVRRQYVEKTQPLIVDIMYVHTKSRLQYKPSRFRSNAGKKTDGIHS